MKKIAVYSLLCIFLTTGISLAESPKAKAGEKENVGLLNRIDFGNSYIMGQSIKSGAVYLLQRKKSEIKSMLKYRTDYREEIMEEFSIREQEAGTKTSQDENCTKKFGRN